jgi:hypothetical protein
MPYLKQGNNFLYDSTTNDIIGIKDADGGEMYFSSLTTFMPAAYGRTTSIGIVAPAATFTSLSASDDGKDGTILASSGVHGLTDTNAVGRHVYVSWSGTGIDGLYEVVDADSDANELVINVPYDAAFGTPTTSNVTADITIVSQVIPANTAKVGMSYQLDLLFGMTGSTNNKTVKANYGSAAWYSQTVAANIQSVCVEKKACVVDSTTIISNALAAPGHGTSTGANVSMTPSGGIAAVQTLQIVGTISTANEFIDLVSWKLKMNGA